MGPSPVISIGFVRQFVKDHPTVYLSTHCPEGYENLEMKRVITL